MHFHLSGMHMGGWMQAGMATVIVGALLAAYGLMPPLARLRKTTHVASAGVSFRVVDSAPLNIEHAKLACVLAIALTIDVMKPASIAFVMPDMAREYGLGASTAGYLALSALIGTAAGSVIWGRLADVSGRRSTILLSSILFMGTATCGTMPSFRGNLAMCFVMGAAAGGMLPVVFTLMAEIVPARHRAWLLVALGGIGASAGYLAASGAAALLEPHFSWRILWLLNLPTGAAIVLLNRYIPESPRFLASAGLLQQAHATMARFAGSRYSMTTGRDAPGLARVPSARRVGQLFRGQYANVTIALVLCGLAWGVTNFGFVLWLPTNLHKLGLATRAAGKLIAQSALLATPGAAAAAWMYQCWSSFKSLMLFATLMVLGLGAFAVMDLYNIRNTPMAMAAIALLLIAISGVIATMLPYATEIYPVHVRGTGTGLVAAGTKAGGILGAGMGVAGWFGNFTWSTLIIAVPLLLTCLMLWRGGVETRGERLESIQRALEPPG
ncbi:MAG TPA: MFS transporter [Rhodanobacteraceae bacterium]|nr:MFS transporter [Rhodanobacteraceae bacterium]